MDVFDLFLVINPICKVSEGETLVFSRYSTVDSWTPFLSMSSARRACSIFAPAIVERRKGSVRVIAWLLEQKAYL